MPSERENKKSLLTQEKYNIAGNSFRAYYDPAHKLVFVLDDSLSADKPNVLLVINPYGDRKWDDVLVNDYALDLETIRPKKDNRYQKLDIEYGNVGVYDDLIQAAESGNNIDRALAALNAFRNASVRRAAAERWDAANITAANARDTITKTNDTIAELQAKLKQLRSKLAQQRRDVGREPTKQSAAKILRTEAQIDATNEKLKRAKKRLQSAQKRLVAAEEDADAARDILDRIPDGAANELVVVRDELPATVPQFREIVAFENKNNESEPRAENMADDEVKPLFDKDPEILNEEIAFKPIEFNVLATPAPRDVTPAEPQADVYVETPTTAPLSFVPPVAAIPADEVPAPADTSAVVPVLDTITAVETPNETVIVDTPIPAVIEQNTAPASETPRVENPTPMPEIAPAPLSSGARPVSPITGKTANNTITGARRPTILYYIMLLALIALSIFTLWIYQRSNNDNVPDLATVADAAPVAEMPAESNPAMVNPFISDAADAAPVAPVQAEPAQISEPLTVEVAEVEAIEEPVPVITEPAAAPMPEVTAPAPVDYDVPAVAETPAVVPDVNIVPVESDTTVASDVVTADPELVVNKPAYNVSQQENMFVAGPEYEVDAEVMDAEVCSDGRAPDMNGCCAGEEYSDIGDGTFACCSLDGTECFPPLR